MKRRDYCTFAIVYRVSQEMFKIEFDKLFRFKILCFTKLISNNYIKNSCDTLHKQKHISQLNEFIQLLLRYPVYETEPWPNDVLEIMMILIETKKKTKIFQGHTTESLISHAAKLKVINYRMYGRLYKNIRLRNIVDCAQRKTGKCTQCYLIQRKHLIGLGGIQ